MSSSILSSLKINSIKYFSKTVAQYTTIAVSVGQCTGWVCKSNYKTNFFGLIYCQGDQSGLNVQLAVKIIKKMHLYLKSKKHLKKRRHNLYTIRNKINY